MSEYYRLEVRDGLVSVVSDYDYSHQDRTNFIRDPKHPDFMLRFDTEREAQQYLNDKIKTEHIHPDWLNNELDQAKLFK